MTFSQFARHRYGVAKETQVCAFGYGSHRSKLESAVCQQIYLREKAGELKHLRHEAFILICGPAGHECTHKAKIEHKVDFLCEDVKTGKPFGIEAKGDFPNETWPMKLRLYRHGLFPLAWLEIWGGTASRLVLKETIEGAA